MHKLIHSSWSVEKWLHFEEFWEVSVAVVKNLLQCTIRPNWSSDHSKWEQFWKQNTTLWQEARYVCYTIWGSLQLLQIKIFEIYFSSCHHSRTVDTLNHQKRPNFSISEEKVLIYEAMNIKNCGGHLTSFLKKTQCVYSKQSHITIVNIIRIFELWERRNKWLTLKKRTLI